MTSPLENTYRRFLLGLASEEEELRVEEAVLTGKLDIQLEDAEDELIDDYLLDKITKEERHGFEERFLTTEDRRERLRFASTLIDYAQKVPADDRTAKAKLVPLDHARSKLSWKYAAFVAAAASILLAIVLGTALTKFRHQTQIAQEAQNAPARPGANSISRGQDKAPSLGGIGATDATARTSTIEVPSTTRGALPTPFPIPADAQFARIEWKLSAPFAEMYQETLLLKGQKIMVREFSKADLSPTKRIVLELPASVLAPGTYHLQLSRRSAGSMYQVVDDWTFNIVRK